MSLTHLPHQAVTIVAVVGSSVDPSAGLGLRAGTAARESTRGFRRRWRVRALEWRSRYARVSYAEDRHQAKSRVIRPPLAQ